MEESRGTEQAVLLQSLKKFFIIIHQYSVSLPSTATLTSSSKSDSLLLLAVKETSSGYIQKQNVSSTNAERRDKLTPVTTQKPQGKSKERFKTRIKSFLFKSSCESLFFMTWISSIESFGDRERFTIESLFKSHPNSCLILVSNSLDCERGTLILKPLTDKGLKVLEITPDFSYIFKYTSAEKWFERLKKGMFSPGVIPLEQNLSNLLRLVLLYKFGGIYLDTDFIILKPLTNLHNVIGAQAVDPVTRKWSRLNNAVLIFDKNHPLLERFINEFTRTFNVDWTRIRGFYRASMNESEANWSRKRLMHLRKHSFAVHLWNRESKKLTIEEGSIIHRLMSESCIFCNSSSSSLHFSY
ncbi:unnamed protein product [Brassica rapa]|uniref:Alpha 1,4-glycosyltransferase domain-containing protein n=2 Tax=Brassica TaxID=3705 RepID=A0A8D9LSY4_BRACM|nr:unnamed protein product [Brassica napus]CAG7885611.1 unnamed protein product [Brassica rapa]